MTLLPILESGLYKLADNRGLMPNTLSHRIAGQLCPNGKWRSTCPTSPAIDLTDRCRTKDIPEGRGWRGQREVLLQKDPTRQAYRNFLPSHSQPLRYAHMLEGYASVTWYSVLQRCIQTAHALCLKSHADDHFGSLFLLMQFKLQSVSSQVLRMGLMADPDRHLVCRQAGGKFCRSNKAGLRSRGARAEASCQTCAEDWKVRLDVR